MLEMFLLWPATGFIAGFGFALFFDWILHRFVMHKPVPGFEYPFRAHAGGHHQVFKSDPTYHLGHELGKETIRQTRGAALPDAQLRWLRTARVAS